MKKNKKLLHLLISKWLVHLLLVNCFLLIGCNLEHTEAQSLITKNIKKEKNIIKMNDEDLAKALASNEAQTSFEAAKEIMRRGDRMLPLLLTNKGNKQPYAWGSLGNPNSGDITFASSNTDWDEGRIVTVEVASLYLISALYYQDFEFAESAYIKDNEDVDFNKYNTDERVSKAWRYTENWLERAKIEGVSSLREKKESPLDESGFYF